MTPTDVHTSVIRCLPSAIEGDRAVRAPGAEQQQPDGAVDDGGDGGDGQADPDALEGWGCRNRSTALTRITAAATKIIKPSTPAEKYSALPWP